MSAAIGQILPLAVGVALSPLPIIAVILMLVSARARVNGPAFVGGWLIGLGTVGAVVLAIAGPTGASTRGEPAVWVSILKLLLGIGSLLIALRQWGGRPRGEEEPPVPKWMGTVEAFTPTKALGAGALLSGLNPKNLLLAVSAAATIAGTGLSRSEQVVAYAIFAIISTVGVMIPLIIYFSAGDRAGPILDKVKHWMGRNNAVITAVLMLVIGAKLIGDGLAGL
jgi:hypothetical protein